MRSIVVANQKGGCAKTTTVVNLAAGLAELGSRVLVLDLDPQANTTAWLGLDGEGRSTGAFDLLASDLPIEELVRQSRAHERICLIPADQQLTNVESALMGKLAVDSVLKRRLSKANLGAFDYVLIDTPPTLGLVTLNALVAVQDVLIPVTTHVLSLSGVAQLLKKIAEIQEILNPDLRVLGVVASRVDSRTRHSREVHDALKSHFGADVLHATIRENIRVAEAPSFGVSVLDYDPKGKSAEDFRALARMIHRTNN